MEKCNATSRCSGKSQMLGAVLLLLFTQNVCTHCHYKTTRRPSVGRCNCWPTWHVSVSGCKRNVHKGPKKKTMCSNIQRPAKQLWVSIVLLCASNKIALPGDHNSNGYRCVCKLVADGESLPGGVLAARLEARPARVHRLNDDTPPVFSRTVAQPRTQLPVVVWMQPEAVALLIKACMK